MLNAVRKFFGGQDPEVDLIANIVANDHTRMYSPDAMVLQQQSHHPVFLYCDRQSTHPRAAVDTERLWDAYTVRRHTLWKHDLGKMSYPIALNSVPAYQRLPHLVIRGEVVNMRTEDLILLDEAKRNRVEFKRIKVPVQVKLHQMAETKERSRLEQIHRIPYQRGDHYPIPVNYTVEVWMYIGIASFWVNIIDNGAIFPPGQIITPNKSQLNENRYYLFPPNVYP